MDKLIVKSNFFIGIVRGKNKTLNNRTVFVVTKVHFKGDQF